MIRNLEEKNIDQVYLTPVLQQTAYWSKVKSRLGIESLALNFKVRSDSVVNMQNSEEAYHDCDLLILLQRLNSEMCYAYVPYGPEAEPADELTGPFLEELSEQLLSYLPNDCIFIRYDLLWKTLWDDEIPDSNIQELRVNFGTNLWNLRKARTNILPSSTILLNLNNDSSALLSGMKPKTRYNIHLSERRGVEIRCAGIESIDVWYELYKETAARNSFYLLNDIIFFNFNILSNFLFFSELYLFFNPNCRFKSKRLSFAGICNTAHCRTRRNTFSCDVSCHYRKQSHLPVRSIFKCEEIAYGAICSSVVCNKLL